eukprot:1161501-Pelagomonas_calceolata.AAC.8
MLACSGMHRGPGRAIGLTLGSPTVGTTYHLRSERGEKVGSFPSSLPNWSQEHILCKWNTRQSGIPPVSHGDVPYYDSHGNWLQLWSNKEEGGLSKQASMCAKECVAMPGRHETKV